MSNLCPMPTHIDLAITPELAILAALRAVARLAIETLHVVHPLGEPLPPHHPDGDLVAAATIVHLAEALCLTIVDYEQRMAGLHETP